MKNHEEKKQNIFGIIWGVCVTYYGKLLGDEALRDEKKWEVDARKIHQKYPDIHLDNEAGRLAASRDLQEYIEKGTRMTRPKVHLSIATMTAGFLCIGYNLYRLGNGLKSNNRSQLDLSSENRKLKYKE